MKPPFSETLIVALLKGLGKTLACLPVCLPQAISITLGDSVTVGSGAIILSPYICSGAVIGAGAVVVKPIENKGIYAGNPARLIRIL